MIAGSMVFLIGAAVGVPRVFMTPDPAERLRMLRERRTAWRLASPLYAVGPLVAAAGVGFLASRGALYAWACATLVLGALSWAWVALVRAGRIREFAYGQLPGWPFVAYVLLTIAGLALLGVALLLDGEAPAWIGWLTIAADTAFLLGFLRYRDIPPFVFYLLFIVIGVVVRT